MGGGGGIKATALGHLKHSHGEVEQLHEKRDTIISVVQPFGPRAFHTQPLHFQRMDSSREHLRHSSWSDAESVRCRIESDVESIRCRILKRHHHCACLFFFWRLCSRKADIYMYLFCATAARIMNREVIFRDIKKNSRHEGKTATGGA